MCEHEKVTFSLVLNFLPHEVRRLDKSRMANGAAWSTIFGRTVWWERLCD